VRLRVTCGSWTARVAQNKSAARGSSCRPASQLPCGTHSPSGRTVSPRERWARRSASVKNAPGREAWSMGAGAAAERLRKQGGLAVPGRRRRAAPPQFGAADSILAAPEAKIPVDGAGAAAGRSVRQRSVSRLARSRRLDRQRARPRRSGPELGPKEPRALELRGALATRSGSSGLSRIP